MNLPALHHPTAIAAPRNLGGGAGPLLLDRDDPDFVAAVLAELGSDTGRARLQATRAQARDDKQRLKLFQPVQRRFHVALIEAWCQTAGQPRLDPGKIDAAGLVLRRVRIDRSTGERRIEGWMRAAGTLRGWVEIDRARPDADPDPAVRQASRATGVAQIDRALRAVAGAGDAALLEEQVTPLFVAPPAVCEAAGRTIYYGMVSTASSDLAQTDADVDSAFEDFGPGSTDFRNHLMQALRGQAWEFPSPPLQDPDRFDADWLDALLAAAPGTREQQLLALLRQLAVEFDVLGESPAATALRDELDNVELRYRRAPGEVVARTVSAARFVADAMAVLFDERGGSVELPEHWPSLDSAQATRLLQAMSHAMRERFRSVRGRPGRFDEPDAVYCLRAFVRLKPDGRCPARTVWTGYGEDFVIAPWYETGGNPVQISLPSPKVLRSLKPNVAFVLPTEMQNLLNRSAKDLMDGKGGKPSSTGIGWICSFSIPVITFCAFIVLNIFLSLFDLIFRWSLFIKICIPFPKAKSS